MSEIVIRRHQADASRTPSDVVLHATDRKRTAVSLKEVLDTMQRDRGRGLWSDSDPEVLVDGAVVGRMRNREAIDELVEHVVERAVEAADSDPTPHKEHG